MRIVKKDLVLQLIIIFESRSVLFKIVTDLENHSGAKKNSS